MFNSTSIFHSLSPHVLSPYELLTAHLRLSQHPQFAIARSIACHEQPALRVPRQPRRPEAAGAETRSVALAALHFWVVEDIFGRGRARQRIHRRVLSVGAELEAHRDQLEAGDGRAVPGAVVRNVHGAGVGIELAVDGRGVREEGEFGGDGLLVARVVVEGAVGGGDEEVTNLEGLVGEVGGLPDSEAGRVAVPVVVWLGDVADVVDFLTWIVLVDVLCLAVYSALKIVAAVLDTPEPVTPLVFDLC
jgi:hypothetical protein